MLDETARLWGLPRRHDQAVPVVGPLGFYPRRLGTLVRYEDGAPQPPVYLAWQEERELAGDFGQALVAGYVVHPASQLEPKSYRMTHQRALGASQLVGRTGWLLFWLRMGDRPWCDGIEDLEETDALRALVASDRGFTVSLRVVSFGEIHAVSGYSTSSPVDAVGRAIHHAVRDFKEPALRCDAFQWLPLELRRLERRGYL